MGEILSEIAKESSGVLTEVYKDGISQSIKPIGTMLSYLPRTVRLGLSKWEKWIINGEESLRLTGEALKDKVDKIPEEKLCEPEPYVAVPAIQQISYCNDSKELRDLYANLLASSMNIDKRWSVHPSFVDLIKQLSPDEAKLLKIFPTDISSLAPLVDCRVVMDGLGGGITVARNITAEFLYSVCDNPENMSFYLENLNRLKVIEISTRTHIKDDFVYKEIENSTRINECKKRVTLTDGQKFSIEKKCFYMTEFGLQFIKCCIGIDGNNS